MIKPGSNENESCWEFNLSLSFGLKHSCALSDSRALLSNLNLLNFFRVVKSFLSFGPGSWELKKTLVSHPSTVGSSRSNLAQALIKKFWDKKSWSAKSLAILSCFLARFYLPFPENSHEIYIFKEARFLSSSHQNAASPCCHGNMSHWHGNLPDNNHRSSLFS